MDSEHDRPTGRHLLAYRFETRGTADELLLTRATPLPRAADATTASIVLRARLEVMAGTCDRATTRATSVMG